MAAILLDTGPLVAYCRADDEYHRWAREQFASIRPPLLTCEAVITEAVYLLSSYGERPELVWEFLRRAVVKVPFTLNTEFEAVSAFMRRYANLPMDLADACLVRMAELNPVCKILTTDGDFRVYRRFGRQIIPLICPA